MIVNFWLPYSQICSNWYWRCERPVFRVVTPDFRVPSGYVCNDSCWVKQRESTGSVFSLCQEHYPDWNRKSAFWKVSHVGNCCGQLPTQRATVAGKKLCFWRKGATTEWSYSFLSVLLDLKINFAGVLTVLKWICVLFMPSGGVSCVRFSAKEIITSDLRNCSYSNFSITEFLKFLEKGITEHIVYIRCRLQ